MDEAVPPAWFAEATLEVEATGFLVDADDPGPEKLWRRWQRERGAKPAPIAEVVLSLLAHDGQRCWKVDGALLRPAPGRALAASWLQQLAIISQGHLELGEVHEIWVRRGILRKQQLVRITYGANDAVLHISPTLDGGLLTVADLLAAANAALTYGSFVTIALRDAGPTSVDGDLICWVDPKTQRRLEDCGFTVTRPAPLPIVCEGRLRDTAPKPVAIASPAQFTELERSALATEQRTDPALNAMRKPAWRPKVVAGEKPDTIDKFGGVPWLPPRTRMPRCPRCKGPTFLALQHAARSLPMRLDLDGVLQVFLCAGDDPGACFIEGEGFVVRLETRPLKPREPDTGRLHAALSIVGWDELSDEPGPCDWPPGLDEDAAADEFDEGPAGGDKCQQRACHLPLGVHVETARTRDDELCLIPDSRARMAMYVGAARPPQPHAPSPGYRDRDRAAL